MICEGNSLMAFDFNDPDMDVRYMIGSIKPGEVADGIDLAALKSDAKDSTKIYGAILPDTCYIGEARVFRFEDKTGYFISMKAGDPDKSIIYRAYLNKTGWTDFAMDGQVCGELEDEENFACGIQVFTQPKSELIIDGSEKKAALPQSALDKAAERLKAFTNRLDRSFLYCDSNFRHAEKSSVNYRIERDLEVKTVEGGMILPLKIIDEDSRDGIFAGGVVDKNGSFVAGLHRKNEKQTNMTVLEAYPVNESEVEVIDEDVIYGGVIFPGKRRFGHMMIETMSRLWYLLDDSDPADTAASELKKNAKIAFVILPESDEYMDIFFKLLGIDSDRILVIKKPTRFKSVTIPEQAFVLFSDYHEKANLIYDKMMSAVEAKDVEKLYLTRRSFTRYDGANDGLNEEYLEEFFKKRGFTVISPEQYSVEEQIGYMKGAKEVICSEGTLSHLGLFCNPGTKMTILRRSLNSYLFPQYMIDEMRGLDVSYVDAHFNILPDSHVDSVFLFGPSPCFKAYLDANKIAYDEDEVKMDMSLMYDYIVKYTENFSDTGRFRSIAKYDLFDLIQTLNKVIRGEYLSRFDYETKAHKAYMENRELTRKVENLEKKLEKSETERKEILNSKSWKITRPLRKLTGKK